MALEPQVADPRSKVSIKPLKILKHHTAIQNTITSNVYIIAHHIQYIYAYTVYILPSEKTLLKDDYEIMTPLDVNQSQPFTVSPDLSSL